VCHRLFTNISWNDAVSKEYPFFHQQLRAYAKTAIEFGKNEEADFLLSKYEPLIKGDDYAEYCDLRCYYYWYQQDFDSAVKWGQRYWDILRSLNPNSEALPHNLLLAWRDSKRPEDVEKALVGFLNSEKLEEVVSSNILNPDLGPHDYGNIGRCLWYGGKLRDAMICYKKSLQLLNKEKEVNTTINKGYAYYWIADALIRQGDKKNASLFYQNALFKWKRVSPPRAKLAEKH
jgi:tetratricopeptide (TPR) repeat protein